jgi:4-amino-4-deoxy-L-arabinose transferase-like glycosyltransferase
MGYRKAVIFDENGSLGRKLMKQARRIGEFLEKRGQWVLLVLLLIFFGRLVNAAATNSITYDEVLHIYYGALYWEHDSLYSVVQNPPLVNAIIGLPIGLAFEPQMPFDHPAWGGNWLEISKAFLWEVNDNGLALILAGRLAVMLLSVSLGALLFRWGRALFQSQAAGLLTLLFYTFDPNILAHSFLATTDLGAAFFIALAAYFIWLYWKRPPDQPVHLPLYLLAGVAVGLAWGAKFSSILLVPAIALLALYRWLVLKRGRPSLGRPSLGRTAVEICGWFVIGALVFLLIYRFDLETLRLDYLFQRDHQLDGHSAFLFGELSIEGWWYYFPVLFAIKTPLPTIFLILLTLVFLVGRREYRWPVVWPLLIGAGFAGASLLSRVNIGYRYLLPVLPLLFLVMGQLARSGQLARPGQWGRPRFLTGAVLKGVTGAAVLLMAIASLTIHPHYLAYFNQLAGGPDNAWRIVADSNIDWGQDIQRLAGYMAEEGIDSVYISWLGNASLPAYGVSGIPIQSWPIIKGDVQTDFFYPPKPAPGVYVISVTQLHGVYLDDPTRFQWFLEREPDGKVGYSLFVYRVEPTGEPVNLALSGIGLDHIGLDDYEQAFMGNDVQIGFYDARTSLLWAKSGGREAWTAVGDGHLPQHPALQALYPADGPALKGETVDGEGVRWGYQFFNWPASPMGERLAAEAATSTGSPVLFDDTVQFLGYELVEERPYQPGERLELLTYWRMVEATGLDLSIYVHLIGPEGELAAQHDGLDLNMTRVGAGDEFAQLHTIVLPENLAAGEYILRTGLYGKESLTRLTVNDGAETSDYFVLQSMAITGSEAE